MSGRRWRRRPAGGASTAAIGLFQVQRFADDVGAEASAKQARGHHLTVGVTASSSQPPGRLDLRGVSDGPNRLAGESAADALCRQLGSQDGGAAGARPLRHQSARERGIIQVAQPEGTGNRAIDRIRVTSFAAQLLAQLELAVRP